MVNGNTDYGLENSYKSYHYVNGCVREYGTYVARSGHGVLCAGGLAP